MYKFLNKEYAKVWLQPMTTEEIKAVADENCFISGVIKVDIFEYVGNGDYEDFLDAISEALTGSSLLMEVSHEIVGITDDGYLLLLVTGDATMILDDEDDDDEGDEDDEDVF